MGIQDNRRFEIARRNQRRALEDRGYKTMMITRGILGYSAVANFVVGATNIFGSGSITVAIFGLVLGVLYAVATYQVWFKSKTTWWLIALPASISIIMAVVSMLAGAIALVPLLLNVVLIVLIPIQNKIDMALAAVPSGQSVSVSNQ